MSISIATPSRYNALGSPPGREPGERRGPRQGRHAGRLGAVRGAVTVALLLLFSTSGLASPTVPFASGTKGALCATTCQAQTAVLCGGLTGPEAERCGEALESACRRGNLRQVCAITSAAAGAVLCQKHNGLVILRNASRGCKPKETEIGVLGEPGPGGATGPTGPTGPGGPPGPQGLPGPTGMPGGPGTPGPTGSVGPTGPAGGVGAVGPTGPTGPTGTTGAPGATGATGATGAGSTVRVTVETATAVSGERPDVGTLLAATASCPPGQQASGGGVSASPSNSADDSRLHTLESGPVPGAVPPVQWFARIGVIQRFSPGSVLTLTVFVLCVPAP